MDCMIRFKRGWKCIREYHMDGPCALVPHWWNYKAKLSGKFWDLTRDK